MSLVNLANIAKSFGPQKVLEDLSLVLNPSQVTLLLGANGSGKSTLLRIIAGLSRPERGTVSMSGRVAFCAHEHSLYPELTVDENLTFFANLLGSGASLDQAIVHWGLGPVRNRRVEQLSKGWQSKIALCRSFLSQPQILLMDEPSASLDTAASELLLAQIALLKSMSGSIIIATHDIARLSPIADRVVVLHNGKIDRDESVSEAGSLQPVIDCYHRLNR